MRITFISPTPNMGGGTKVIAIYARLLRDMGHEVCIVSPLPPVATALQNFKLWLNGNRWRNEQTRTRSHLEGTGIEHRQSDRYRPITDQDVPDADVVIATWWETAEWVATLSPRKGAKVYFIQHHEIFDYLPKDRVRATYNLPLHKVVIAHWLKQLMEKEYGDSTVDVVPNSVDRTQFFTPVRGKQPAPSIGFLYSKTPFKGLDTTLAAVRKVCARTTGVRIVSFGVDRVDRRLALPARSEYTRLPPQHAIRNIYARCDVWITASRSEGFNLPALEAMACRTPVVSTCTGWPQEAIKPGWNGLLVDIDDVAGLAQATEWVLTRNEHDWRTLSANAHLTASSGSWEQSATLFEQALERAHLRSVRGRIEGSLLRPSAVATRSRVP